MRRNTLDTITTSGAPTPKDDLGSTDRQIRLLTIPAAAGLLGVSRSKLYELLAEGALPTVRIGRSRRIAIADLEVFVRRSRDLG